MQRLIRGFCARGILTQLARGNAAKRMPATYRVNEEALEEDPRMARYRSTGQKQLPGISRPSVPGEPIPDRDLVAPCHLVTPRHQSGGTMSPNSRNDSRNTTLPNPPFQGGDLVLNSTSKENARAREASEIPNDFHGTLTRRDRESLNKQIYLLMQDSRHDFNSAMETACAQLMIPLDDARAAARASGIDPINKSPRRDGADA